MVKTKLNIFDYVDYREYIEASFEYTKRTHPNWSYENFTRKLGLRSNTSIIKIVKKQRDAGPKTAAALVRFFNFDENEAQYFETLIRLSKAKNDPGLAKLLFEQVLRAKSAKKSKKLKLTEFSMISNWWNHAVRQLARSKALRNSPSQIASQFRFKVTPLQVRKSIDSLLKLGLLEKGEDEQLVATSQSTNVSSEVGSSAIKIFHESMLKNARIALLEMPTSERFLSGVTILVKEEKYPQACEFLDKMMDEFCERFEDEEGSDVFQAQVQFFPLTKKRNK